MDQLLLCQTIFYFIIFLFGLITSISSGIARDNFGGACILYGTANCTSNETFVLQAPGFSSVCTFIPTGNLITSVLYAFCVFCYHAYYTHRSRIVGRAAYQMALKMLCFGAVLAAFLTTVAGGAVTTGLAEWCDSVAKSSLQHLDTAISCSYTQSPALNWTLADDTLVFAGDYFYEYSLAQVSCWFCVVLWFLQIALCIYRLVKQSQLQTSYTDPFIMDTMDAFT